MLLIPIPGPFGGTSGFKDNPTGELAQNNEQYGNLTVPLTRWAALVNGHYNFNDHLSAFIEATFSRNQTQAVGSPLRSIQHLADYCSIQSSLR